MSIENPNFREEKEPEPDNEKLKTDWSFLDDTSKEQKGRKRAKMTPEELAKDDRKTKEAEDLLKWAEMSNKRKSSDPREKAEAKEYFDEKRKKESLENAEKNRGVNEKIRRSLEKIAKDRDEKIARLRWKK